MDNKINIGSPLEIDEKIKVVEAVIFIEADPQPTRQIAKLTGIAIKEVSSILEKLQEHYCSSDHGLELIEIAGGYAFSPKKEIARFLYPSYGKELHLKLSRAAMETLAIIAYSQPITRSEIESIRGVAPDSMIRLLHDRKLIKEMGKSSALGRPIQYGTSSEFLKQFGLNTIADLPRLNREDQAKFGLNKFS